MNPASDDLLFRGILIAFSALIFPILIYHRVRSQATGERLDRMQEGPLILFTLRPIGVTCMLGLFAYMIEPRWMAWSSMAVPAWVRWVGVGMGLCGGALLIWTLRTLGPNLTDTVVTRKAHELVTSGPYRYVRHPFYAAITLSMAANALVAANWFLLTTGAIALALIAIRTRTEEAKLLERFGDSYRTYRARTGAILPKRRP